MDKNYWNTFYSNNEFDLLECSNFCLFVVNYFSKYETIKYILDAGCGNGRDSYYLCKKYYVEGVDSSGFVPNNCDNVTFFKDDFVKLTKTKYDLIYSRFTFHSITNDEHKLFLDSIPYGKYLAIEARSNKGMNEILYHGNTHYRNYIGSQYLKDLLSNTSFDIMYFQEGDNMAIYKNENPICIRVICYKRKKEVVK